MADNDVDPATFLLEMAMGSAVAVALVFHVLESKGVLKHSDVDAAIRGACEMIPDEYAGEPRFRVLACLLPLLEDPELRHALPFPWRSS